MLSKEKLQDIIDNHIAEALAEQVFTRIQSSLQEQWDKVVYELASTRKNNERMKESIGSLVDYTRRLEALIERLEAKTKISEENQRKATEILRVATKELGLSE